MPAEPPPPANPCVRNCCLDDADICLGCFRSLEEILQWGKMNAEQRQQVLNHAKRRRQNDQPPSTP